MTDRELMQQALEALERCVATCFDQHAHEQVMSRPEHFASRASRSRRAAMFWFTLERFAALVAAHEREACAELVWPTEQVKVWSEEELTAMTGAFNRAQEKHGWYETIMAVGAAALKHRAAAIRARGLA
jgi:hypothetical protein